MKILKTITFTLVIGTSVAAYGGERADINQVLKEITYTKEVVKKLKQKYGKNRAKVRFNYDGMLAQLNAAEMGIKEYLNLNIKSLHAAPPKPVVNSLYHVRKN